MELELKTAVGIKLTFQINPWLSKILSKTKFVEKTVEKNNSTIYFLLLYVLVKSSQTKPSTVWMLNVSTEVATVLQQIQP